MVRIHYEGENVKAAYRVANAVVDNGKDNPYIDAERTEWETQNDVVLDLNALGLNMTEGKRLYLDFSAAKSYSGNATITIYEKGNEPPAAQ